MTSTPRMIEHFSRQIAEKCVRIDIFDTIIQQFGTVINAKELENRKKAEEFDTLLLIIQADLLVLLRGIAMAKTGYGQTYVWRQVVIMMNECFKRLYHFHNAKKERENSFWVKDIKKIVEKDMPDQIDRYETISRKLESYEQEVSDLKSYRDDFVHYNSPIEFCDKMLNLNKILGGGKGVDLLWEFIKIIGMMEVFMCGVVGRYNNGQAENEILDELIEKIGNVKNADQAWDILDHFKIKKK